MVNTLLLVQYHYHCHYNLTASYSSSKQVFLLEFSGLQLYTPKMKTMHARVFESKKVKSDCVSMRTFNFSGNAGIQKDCTEGIHVFRGHLPGEKGCMTPVMYEISMVTTYC